MAKPTKPADDTVETPNVPMNIEDQIKKELAAQSGQVGAMPVNKIGTKGKKFWLPDGQSSEGPLEVVIVDFVWNMVHYPGAFNSNNPQKPDCFAIGRDKPDGGLLVAHETVAKPYGEDCGSCPKNQWKSAQSGNGKACKNQRRLLVVPPNFDEGSEPMTLYVSPVALKNFDAYITRLKNEHGLLPVQVITEITFDPNQTYPLLQFKFLAKHDNLSVAWGIKERSQEALFREIELADGKAKAA